MKKKRLDNEYWKVLFLRTVGNFLLFSSLFMIGKTFYEPVRAEVKFFLDSQVGKKYLVADSTEEKDETIVKGGLQNLISENKVEVLVPNDPNFSVVIPKVGANANIQANVNAADEEEYLDALQRGVAHARGTAFPGEEGHIFLFAHSTDYFWNIGSYNAVFYLLYKLDKGDEIDIFYKGQRYVYKVFAKTIVDPSQVEYLTRKTNKEFLTLQTCWPPGTTLKRLLVFASRVSN